jgi:mono/diheme cytochrome c family protein
MKRTLTLLVLLLSGGGLAAAPKESPELLAKGKAIFDAQCALCHGEKGDPDTSIAGKAMNPKPRNLATDTFKVGDSPDKVFDSISKGLPGTAMAPFGHLPEEDRWGLTYHVLGMRKNKSKK